MIPPLRCFRGRYNTEDGTQKFYLEHTDDIVSLALNKSTRCPNAVPCFRASLPVECTAEFIELISSLKAAHTCGYYKGRVQPPTDGSRDAGLLAGTTMLSRRARLASSRPSTSGTASPWRSVPRKRHASMQLCCFCTSFSASCGRQTHRASFRTTRSLRRIGRAALVLIGPTACPQTFSIIQGFHKKAVCAVSFSADGKRLLSLDVNDTVGIAVSFRRLPLPPSALLLLMCPVYNTRDATEVHREQMCVAVR